MLLKKYYRQKYFIHYLPAVILSFLIITALQYGCAGKEEYDELEAKILLSGQKVEIFEGEKIYFNAEATGGQPPYDFSWAFGATIPPSSLKEPGLIAFALEGGYKVVLTVKDSSGTTSEDYVYIGVQKKSF